MTEVDRDEIFLLFALTECARALRAIEEVQRLVGKREQAQPGVERREWQSVFDYIRLALQFSASVSRIFWPYKAAKERGNHLRAITKLPLRHSLADRTLRNHIEHLDERLDQWTHISPRPFLTTEMILYGDYPKGEEREAITDACAIVYDEQENSVFLFGDVFSLNDLQRSLLDVRDKCSIALSS